MLSVNLKRLNTCNSSVRVDACELRSMKSRRINIVEVGPRDGLQSEPEILSTKSKVEFITRAIDAGVKRLEVASFVHPGKVPQMADAEALLEALPFRTMCLTSA